MKQKGFLVRQKPFLRLDIIALQSKFGLAKTAPLI